MFCPTHIDGRTLVILQYESSMFSSQFRVLESGRLRHDGVTLELIPFAGGEPRVVRNDELAAIQVVSEINRIPECSGFDLFLLQSTG
jgi:hypothetical protein